MKIYIVWSKITVCALVITAIHTAFGSTGDTTTPQSGSWSGSLAGPFVPYAAWAAQKAAQQTAQAGRALFPYVRSSVEATTPYLAAGAEKIGQAASKVNTTTRGWASATVTALADQQWPAMAETLARIKSALYRLNNSVGTLTAVFDNITGVLSKTKMDEIDRLANLNQDPCLLPAE